MTSARASACRSVGMRPGTFRPPLRLTNSQQSSTEPGQGMGTARVSCHTDWTSAVRRASANVPSFEKLSTLVLSGFASDCDSAGKYLVRTPTVPNARRSCPRPPRQRWPRFEKPAKLTESFHRVGEEHDPEAARHCVECFVGEGPSPWFGILERHVGNTSRLSSRLGYRNHLRRDVRGCHMAIRPDYFGQGEDRVPGAACGIRDMHSRNDF